ncbi:membrane protein [Campylobacter insulaenigrae]|uniref:hypothetical protein n=1 Tax=Campylobacter insulaenigrae TaxID=260714 RepID=UPI000F6C1D01|nr:hypothetical protein [Campylobacter insulaenigrae]MCR6590742.1 hypothetical protein [Campylobacter insulaenigrae]MCR6592419.1 hypothetical protein [Campylobacter insulaenigrae]VEJ52688.1 membrane protein [Campylobacter insulaenigrae]
MKYSLIEPKLKPIFNLFTRIWIYFTIISVSLILITFVIIIFKNSYAYIQISNKQEELSQIQIQIEQNQLKLQELQKQNNQALNIFGDENNNGKNLALLKSVQNLFSLVPKDISLDEVVLEKNSLILRGITPTQEMFSLLLEAPLRSVFDSSKTTYYPLKNGWYRFVSVNTSAGENNE